jgi:type II secretory pathway pseudopilin PulG
MFKNTLKQQIGFTVLEIVLVVIIITGLVGVGGYTYARINDTQKDSSLSLETTQSKANESVSRSEGYVYEPADKAYKITLPDGWKFLYSFATEENQNTSFLYAPTSSMTNVKGVDAQVKNMLEGYGPETGFSLSVHKNIGPVGYGQGLKVLDSFKTTQGKQVDAFQDEEATEPFGESTEGGSDFFAQYEYYVVGSNNTVYKFVYSLSAGDESQKEIVEKMIKTIRIP